jgi:hypothetical protein
VHTDSSVRRVIASMSALHVRGQTAADARAVALSGYVPGSAGAREAAVSEERIQRELWRLAGAALDMAPMASAPRLYVETLNEMFDAETVRVAALSNRVPTPVLARARLRGLVRADRREARAGWIARNG